MVRRNALKSFLPLLLMPLVLQPKLLRAENTNTTAERLPEPVSTVTIAVSIAKLFFGIFFGGPSITDLITNLNKQIKVVDEKLTILLNEIQSLRDDVRKLPEIINVELLTNSIQACLAQYKTIMDTLIDPQNKYKGNIDSFLKSARNRKIVNTLLVDVHSAKLKLRQYPNPDLVPYMALALHIEYFIETKMLKTNILDLKFDIDQDLTWLTQNVFSSGASLESRLRDLKLARTKLSGDLSYEISGITHLYQNAWHSFYTTAVCTVVKNSNKDIEDIKLLKLQALIENDLNDSSYQVAEHKFRAGQMYRPYGHDLGFDVDIQNKDLLESEMLKVSVRKLSVKNVQITDNYKNQIRTAASYYSGLQAIEYCQNLLRN